MHGVANYDARYAESPRQPGQGTQVFAWTASSLQRQHRLRREPQFIRHSYPDTAIANVKAEIAGLWGSYQFLAPGS